MAAPSAGPIVGAFRLAYPATIWGRAGKSAPFSIRRNGPDSLCNAGRPSAGELPVQFRGDQSFEGTRSSAYRAMLDTAIAIVWSSAGSQPDAAIGDRASWGHLQDAFTRPKRFAMVVDNRRTLTA